MFHQGTLKKAALRGILRDRMGQAGVDHHVDARHLAGLQGPFKGRFDLFRPLHEFSVTAQSLCHQVISNHAEFGAAGPVVAEEHLLAVLDHPPCLIIADHANHGQAVAHGGVDLHAVQAEGTIA